ncbi:MAG: CapA family protein [Veillonellales bacterium]
MDKTISIVATGDSFITQRLPHNDPNLQKLRDYLMKHDVRFTNLEVLLHNFDVYPSATSGGTWSAARPQVLSDLKWLGFNMFAWANNHTLDWCHNGLLSTRKYLEEAECIHAGAGINLAEASQPRYLDTPQGRVALIGTTSTANDWHRAGAQRPDVLGRPGVNALRYNAIHKVTKEDLARLKSIIGKTEINAKRMLDEKEGFAKKQSGFIVGTLHFEIGEPGTETRMNEQDAERIRQSITEASRQADVVLVSHHGHEMKGMDKDRTADFMREYAHMCIDSGAHAYLGHGPHILRGIEIYKSRPIFYSLGDFIFQNDSVEKQPTEFYDIYNLGPTNTPSDGFDARSENETKGLVVDRRVFESVVVSFNIFQGNIKAINLTPISLGFEFGRSRRGRPQLSSVEDGVRILNDLQRLSNEFGTVMDIKDGLGIINI